jgi:hypothetical protein
MPPPGIGNAIGVPSVYGRCQVWEGADGGGGGAMTGRGAGTPGAATGGGGGAGPAWGRVKPHFWQKSEPSGASSPQCRQTVMAGGKINCVYHRQVHGETPVGRAHHAEPRALQ